MRPFRLFAYSNIAAWRFSEISRELRRKGSLVGANNTWIAATALGKDQPLGTRHADEFRRVADLEIHSTESGRCAAAEKCSGGVPAVGRSSTTTVDGDGNATARKYLTALRASPLTFRGRVRIFEGCD